MHNTEVKDTPSHVVKYVDLNLFYLLCDRSSGGVVLRKNTKVKIVNILVCARCRGCRDSPDFNATVACILRYYISFLYNKTRDHELGGELIAGAACSFSVKRHERAVGGGDERRS